MKKSSFKAVRVPASPTVESGSVPAFLIKLWRMVNDPDVDHLIAWDPTGKYFIIHNRVQFWCELLPQYYKHNNMSSFIRQLNMYGFHKLQAVFNEAANDDCDDKAEVIRFQHPFFRRGQQHLLKNIKRKISAAKAAQENRRVAANVSDITTLITEVNQLKGRQENVDNQLLTIKTENGALWREIAVLRQKHLKQQQVINKLIHFLVTVVQQQGNRTSNEGLSMKRRLPLMLRDAQSQDQKRLKTEGLKIHELDNAELIIPDPELLDVENSEDVKVVGANGLADSDIDEVNVLTTTPVIDSPPSSAASVINVQPGQVAESPCEYFDLTEDSQEESPLSPEALLTASPSLVSPLITNCKSDPSITEDLSFSTVSRAEQYIKGKKKENKKNLSEYDCMKLPSGNWKQSAASKVLLNPHKSDAMIGNLMSRSSDKSAAGTGKQITTGKNDLSLATRNSNSNQSNFVKINSVEDVSNHLESVQGHLEEIMDGLYGLNGIDANTLLGLFGADDPLSYELNITPEIVDTGRKDDDVLNNVGTAGLELAPYSNLPPFDFDDILLSDTSDLQPDAVDNTIVPEEEAIDAVTDKQAASPNGLPKETGTR